MLPFSLDPELRKISRTLFIQRDAIGVTQMIVWTARKPFIDKNRAALVDFMEDSLRIVRWYLDPEEPRGGHGDRGARHQAAGRAVRLDVHQARTPTAIPNMLPDLAALQRNVDMTRDLGFVRGTIDVKKHADLEPRRRSREAAER